MKSNEYWSKRFVLLEKSQLNKGQSLNRDIEKHYSQALRKVEDDISGWYSRFATNNEISMTEARSLLNKRELKEFQWSVEDYINYGRKNALDPRWMKELENASARVHISKLESVKLQIQQQMEVLHGNQLDDLDGLMRDIYSDGYYHTAYEIQKGFNIGWDLQKINQKQLDRVISKPWTVDGKTFSDRIWTNKDQLVGSVHNQLTQGILLGRSPKEAISSIANEFQVSRNKAGRLVMTESAFFASAAQQKAFEDLDVELYEIVATLDMDTSDICQNLDGQVFDMKDYQVGVSAPPFHPWCRSVTAPYFEDDDDSMRAARGADGQTYYVDGKMKYDDWKKSFVDGGSKKNLKPVVLDDKKAVDMKDLLQEKREQLFARRSDFKDDNLKLIDTERSINKKGAEIDRSTRELEQLDKKLDKYEATKLFTQEKFDDLEKQYDQLMKEFENDMFNRPKRGTPERESWNQKFGHMSMDEINEQLDELYRKQNTLVTEGGKFEDAFDFRKSFDYEGSKRKAEELRKQISDLNDDISNLNQTKSNLIADMERIKTENAKLIAEIDKIDDGERLRPKVVAGVDRGEMMSIDDANHGKPNPNYSKGGGYTINCQSCVVSYEARLRGYDVSTLPNTRGSKLEELSRATNKAWIDPLTGEHAEYIFDNTITTPKGYLKFMEGVVEKDKRYTFEFAWKGRSRSGHIISMDRTAEGVLRLYDPQIGRSYTEGEVLNYLQRLKYTETSYGIKIPRQPKIMRVDDKEFNLDMVNSVIEGAVK